tara:strand:+ start:871 stop:1575 length:705 start_codon:yes stop_codon:yes gene_type:complete
MNGINIQFIHVYVTAWIICMLLAAVLLINEVFLSQYLFILGGCAGFYMIGFWSYSFLQTKMLRKSAVILGAFGVGMFVFSYAMVPMYHLVCHATASVIEERLDEGVILNMVARSYRQLPLTVVLSNNQMSLRPDVAQKIYVDIYNTGNQQYEVKANLVVQPRSLSDRFNVLMPTDITVEPNQHMRFPIEMTYLGLDESLPQASMMLLLQDKEDEGELGKTGAWQKMTQGVRIKQ